jgi:penicillin-binding protein 1A
VAGVWVGNDEGKPMKGVSGSTLPALIWREVMLAKPAPVDELAVVAQAPAQGGRARDLPREAAAGCSTRWSGRSGG